MQMNNPKQPQTERKPIREMPKSERSKLHKIIVAGTKSIKLTFDLQCRGYVHVAATETCGQPTEQCDVASADWGRRGFRPFEPTLDWLVDLLSPAGGLVVWIDLHKLAARRDLRATLERRGFLVEPRTARENSSAV
jgi:hypothetical protein